MLIEVPCPLVWKCYVEVLAEILPVKCETALQLHLEKSLAVNVLSDEVGSLRIFIPQVNALAQRLGGQSTSELLSTLLTTDEPDEISWVGDEIESMPCFHKVYKFSSYSIPANQ